MLTHSLPCALPRLGILPFENLRNRLCVTFSLNSRHSLKLTGNNSNKISVGSSRQSAMPTSLRFQDLSTTSKVRPIDWVMLFRRICVPTEPWTFTHISLQKRRRFLRVIATSIRTSSIILEARPVLNLRNIESCRVCGVKNFLLLWFMVWLLVFTLVGPSQRFSQWTSLSNSSLDLSCWPWKRSKSSYENP